MKLFMSEFKKMFIFNKGYIILILVILAQVFYYNYENKYYNISIEQHKTLYHENLATYGGEIDVLKKDKLNELEKNINASEIESLQLFDKLYQGELTPDEYDKQLMLFRDISNKKAVLKELQQQYYYAEDDPSKRYVMDTNGWSTAMNNNGLDLILIIYVIFIATKCFCIEYETDMYSIMHCTHKGRYKTALVKTSIIIIVTVVIGLIFSLIPIMSSQIEFGLYNSDYPVQSLNSFSSCPYNMSILQTYVLIWCLKIFSLCIMSSITVLLSVLLKKSIPVFFMASILLIIPYYMFNLNFIMKFIPQIGLDLNSYYFTGVPKKYSEQVLMISSNNFIGICVVGFLIMSFCVIISIIIWKNINLKRMRSM